MEQTKDPGYVPGWGGRHSRKQNVQDTGVETEAGRRQGLHEFSRMATRRSSLGRTRSSQSNPGRSRGSAEPEGAQQSCLNAKSWVPIARVMEKWRSVPPWQGLFQSTFRLSFVPFGQLVIHSFHEQHRELGIWLCAAHKAGLSCSRPWD